MKCHTFDRTFLCFLPGIVLFLCIVVVVVKTEVSMWTSHALQLHVVNARVHGLHGSLVEIHLTYIRHHFADGFDV